jgi:hypothetical protein
VFNAFSTDLENSEGSPILIRRGFNSRLFVATVDLIVSCGSETMTCGSETMT